MESQRLKAPQLRTASLKRPRSPEAPKALSSANNQADKKAAQSSQPNKSSPRKKARLSASPTSSLVPSSQSDEEELPTPRTNTPSKSTAKENVKRRRKKTLPLTPDPVVSSASSSSFSVEMDVDEPSYSSEPATPATSEQEISAQLNESPGTSGSEPTQTLTPPYTDGSSDVLPPLPPTPVALTAEEKSAQIIQQIKARALAAVQSSPEYSTIEMPELSESDDEDDPLLQPLNLGTSRPNPAPSASAGPSLRRSSRQRTSLSGTSDGSPASLCSRLSPEGALDDGLPQPRPKPRARPNPIEALLKEKRNAEKGGKGSDAFLTAELSLMGKGLMLEEMSLEDLEDDDLDYDNLKNLDHLPSFSLGSYQPSDDLALNEEDRKTLFGEEEGGDINGILRSEARARKAEAEEAKKRAEGVPLWATGGGEDCMMVDEQQLSIPALAPGTNSATLRMIDQALQQRDFTRAAWLLKSCTLSSLAAADDSDVLNALCILATSAKLFELPISEVAFRIAIDLLENTIGGKAQVSSSFVIRAMLELGAPAERLESVKVKYDHVPHVPVDLAKRADALYRVVALISQAAIARRIPAQEIPDLVISLVLMTMDTSNPVQLQQELVSAINNVFEFLPGSSVNGSNRELESTLASRLVGLAESFQPVNKAFLVSIFASGVGATMRIARFVAYCMVTGATSQSVTSKTYCDSPPLPRLLSLLIEPANNKAAMDHSQISPFIINTNTDYTVMKFFVYIFGIALSDIKSYVWDERNKERDAVRAGGRPSRSSKEKKPETDLQLLHDLMEELHASINDLRAAHLDRSRVKAAVKQLQMRIYYQRRALERAWKDQNLPKANLNDWIKRKPLKVGP
ncbi:hypothetical protein H1R20_g5632, partial [Candolleomyces eurysporus]